MPNKLISFNPFNKAKVRTPSRGHAFLLRYCQWTSCLPLGAYLIRLGAVAKSGKSCPCPDKYRVGQVRRGVDESSVQ